MVKLLVHNAVYKFQLGGTLSGYSTPHHNQAPTMFHGRMQKFIPVAFSYKTPYVHSSFASKQFESTLIRE